MDWNIIGIIVAIFGIITGVLMAISENKRKIGIGIIIFCFVAVIGLIIYTQLPIPKEGETILDDIDTASPPLTEFRNPNESEYFTNNNDSTTQPQSSFPANNSIRIELSQWIFSSYDGDGNLNFIGKNMFFKESQYVDRFATFSYGNESLIPNSFEISLSKDGINYEIKEEVRNNQVFYIADNLPYGVYYVTATCEGFVNYSETITLTEGGRMQFEVILMRDMPLTTYFTFQLNTPEKAYSLQFFPCGETAFSFVTPLDRSAMYRTYSTIRLDILDDDGNIIYINTTNENMTVLVID